MHKCIFVEYLTLQLKRARVDSVNSVHRHSVSPPLLTSQLNGETSALIKLILSVWELAFSKASNYILVHHYDDAIFQWIIR